MTRLTSDDRYGSVNIAENDSSRCLEWNYRQL